MKPRVVVALALAVIMGSLFLAASLPKDPPPCPAEKQNCDPTGSEDQRSGLRVGIMVGGALVGGALYFAAFGKRRSELTTDRNGGRPMESTARSAQRK